MPWRSTQVSDQRLSLVIACQQGRFPVGEVCMAYGISRKTGYKWLERYRRCGKAGLEDRSRARHIHPNAASEEVVEQVLVARHRHPLWGPKKLKALLQARHPGMSIPAQSTIGEILRRAGLSVPRRRRRAVLDTEARRMLVAEKANDVWTADYKGWIRNGDGTRASL